MNIDIKSPSGQLLLSTPINTGAKGYFQLMQHDYITLPFVAYAPIDFGLGSYADLRGVFPDALGGKLAKTYHVTDLQTPTYNTSTGGYEYELRLDAYYWLWKNKIFKYTPENAGQEASWSLTAALDVHLGVFLRNLTALGYTYGGEDFEFSIDSTVENKAVALTYDNTRLTDALSMMAEAWDCEWWVTDNVIHFGRLENGDAVELEIGVSAETMTRNESKGTYATRIYAFGSTRNIPTNYRPSSEQAVVNGVVQKRLMLPEGTPYIDAYPNMTRDQIVETVVVLENVYPRRTGTLSDVQTVDRAVTGEDGEQVDTFKAYQYKDTGLTFDSSYIIPDQELRIVFQSGKLNGLDFGVTFNPNNADPAEQLWEIVANEDYGRLLPDETIKPENGDTYILYGFDIDLVSDQYVPAAEQELKQEAEEYAAKTKIDDGTYTVPLYSSWVEADEVNRTFDAGQKVKLVNPAFFGTEGRVSRVIGWEMCLDIPHDRPVYTVGESAQYSRLGELEDKVDAITYGGQTYVGGGGSGIYLIKTNDSTPASNNNVYSALRSLAMFLRKDAPDTDPFLLTLLQGAIFGKDGFASGLTGFGAKIDEYGNGEMESLFVRRKLVVPLLVYNRAEVQMGDKWRAPGVGIIETVDTENKVCTLRLEDGEIGAVAKGDICMGIYHSMNSAENATEDYDDSLGNRRFSGFCTVYFTITEVMGDRNEQFKYQVRPVSERWTSTFDPFEQMTFVAYGNFSDESRQTSVYETRTYTRMLWKQNTWEIAAGNIALQYGDLSNLNIHGMDMTGYSMYLNNVYFTGTILQTKPDGTPIRTANDRGAWPPEDNHADFYDRFSYNGSLWLCVNEDGTSTAPAEGNPDWLKQVDKGETGAKGEDGKSVRYLGRWYTGLLVPYLGIVRMGTASYMCIAENGTTNPPLWTVTDKNGNRLQQTQDGGKTYGYILTGEMNTAEYALVAEDGLNGTDGIQGPKGEDGRTTYFHIKYSANPDGNPMSETPNIYIGTYVDYTEADSDDYTKYTWSRFQGMQGEKGIPGTNGANGITYYLHIKYSDDGGATFTANNGETPGKFMGQLVDTNEMDSSNPSAYKWSQIRGEDGQSPQLLGNWKTGLFVPYLGIVRMGGASWSCKVAGGTTNPPLWTVTDKNGNRLLQTQDGGKTYGYILTGEKNTGEYELVAEDGQKGEGGAPGKDGEQGLQGCILRTSEWKSGTEYRNDEALTSGTRYLDVALVKDANTATGWRAYKCKATHTASTANAPGNTTYWEEFGMNTTSLFTSLIIAKNALIEFMSGNQLLIKKDNGTITIGLTGNYGGKAYIWAGGTNPGNARFRVDETGKVVAVDGEFSGVVNATSGTFSNVKSSNGSFSIDTQGNVSIRGKFSTQINGKRIEIDPDDNCIRIYNEHGYEVGCMEFFTDSSFGSNISIPRIKLTRVDAQGESDASLTATSTGLTISQSFRDGNYSASLDVTGLVFSKNGQQTRKYSNT